MNESAVIGTLKGVCARMRKNDPEGWRSFLLAVEGYEELIKDKLVGAQPAHLQTAQGAAQQCVALRKLFNEA